MSIRSKYKVGDRYLFTSQLKCTYTGSDHGVFFMLELDDKYCENCGALVLWSSCIAIDQDPPGVFRAIGTCDCHGRMWKSQRSTNGDYINAQYKDTFIGEEFHRISLHALQEHTHYINCMFEALRGKNEN